MSLELGSKLDQITVKHTREGLCNFRADLASLIGNIESVGYKINGVEGAEFLLTVLLLTRMPQSLLTGLLRSNKDFITTLAGFHKALNLEIELLA